jgi:hypothetical protein
MDVDILKQNGVEPANIRRTAARCYNLLKSPGPDERNPEYATPLQLVLEKLNFPSEYVASVC